MTDWCILRCSSVSTLRLASSLAEAGLATWTPTAKVRKVKPRSDKFRDVDHAILAGFVFAGYDHLPDLFAILHAPVSDHPGFTIFHHGDTVPKVLDRNLGPLREYEARLAEQWQEQLRDDRLKGKRKRSRAARYVLGQRVTVPDTAFEGLVGRIVEIRKNGNLVLMFEGLKKEATVAPCFVEAINVEPPLSEQSKAA